MTVAESRRMHAPPRRTTAVRRLDPIVEEPEHRGRGSVIVHDLWGASPAYPHLTDVGVVARWLAHLYAVSEGSELRKAGAIVLWTIDSVLRERDGVEVLDAILAGVNVERITSGAVIALVRGTHHTGDRLRSRREFLLRARARLLALGRISLIERNSDLAELGPDDHAAER